MIATANKHSRSRSRVGSFPTWFLLTGILLIPSSLAVHLAGEGAKFTPGRAAIALLLIPAFLKFFRERRRFVVSDLFIFLAGIWMIGSRLHDEGGLNPSAIAEVIELVGGYFVARAYFFGAQALHGFMSVFKILLIIIILLASVEPLIRRNAVTAITSSLFHTPVAETQFRMGLARAQSTIEDSELFGTLCTVGACLLLYMGPTGARKVIWILFCFFGCLLSISSGPLGAFLIVLAAYIYDRMLHQYKSRWKLFVASFGGFLALIFVSVNRPVSWLISHMLFDPGSSYFRLYVFDYYYGQIALSPLTGWGFGEVGDDDFLSKASIDNVWIVFAVRFGLPMIALLFLGNVTAFFPARLRGGKRRVKTPVDDAGTGFTFALSALMGVGVSVHYWNAIFMFWAVCIGVRASIKEFASSVGARTPADMINAHSDAQFRFAAVSAKR